MKPFCLCYNTPVFKKYAQAGSGRELYLKIEHPINIKESMDIHFEAHKRTMHKYRICQKDTCFIHQKTIILIPIVSLFNNNRGFFLNHKLQNFRKTNKSGFYLDKNVIIEMLC